jgi:hypothetical protein
MSATSELFEKLLDSPPGTRCLIERTNFSEAEKIRMSLYRQREKLQKVNPAIAERILISRHTVPKTNLYEVSVTLLATPMVKKAEFIFPSGKKEAWLPTKQEEHVKRMRELMEEEGLSEEEIDFYMKGGC